MQGCSVPEAPVGLLGVTLQTSPPLPGQAPQHEIGDLGRRFLAR